MQKLVISLSLLFVASTILGCGASDAPELATVKGTVKLDGSPVPNADIMFIPDSKAGTKGPASSAKTDAQGNFELTGTGARSGAIIGKHKVTVTCPAPSSGDGTGEAAAKCSVPEKYSDPGTTDISVEVKDGENDIPIELKSK